jgi:hypothetical protein
VAENGEKLVLAPIRFNQGLLGAFLLGDIEVDAGGAHGTAKLIDGYAPARRHPVNRAARPAHASFDFELARFHSFRESRVEGRPVLFQNVAAGDLHPPRFLPRLITEDLIVAQVARSGVVALQVEVPGSHLAGIDSQFETFPGAA